MKQELCPWLTVKGSLWVYGGQQVSGFIDQNQGVDEIWVLTMPSFQYALLIETCCSYLPIKLGPHFEVSSN